MRHHHTVSDLFRLCLLTHSAIAVLASVAVIHSGGAVFHSEASGRRTDIPTYRFRVCRKVFRGSLCESCPDLCAATHHSLESPFPPHDADVNPCLAGTPSSSGCLPVPPASTGGAP